MLEGNNSDSGAARNNVRLFMPRILTNVPACSTNDCLRGARDPGFFPEVVLSKQSVLFGCFLWHRRAVLARNSLNSDRQESRNHLNLKCFAEFVFAKLVLTSSHRTQSTTSACMVGALQHCASRHDSGHARPPSRHTPATLQHSVECTIWARNAGHHVAVSKPLFTKRTLRDCRKRALFSLRALRKSSSTGPLPEMPV